jgi:thymidine kinase
MFVEVHATNLKAGWVEVICGSMFSGKTEELIRRLRRAQIALQSIDLFKPSIDNRYHEEEVVSHSGNSIPSRPVTSSQQILLYATGAKVVGIDEAQFFDAELPIVIQQLANRGSRVIVAGLDMDYTGKPFGPMPAILAQAEFITKVHAICQKCGSLANYSYRKVPSKNQIVLGEKESYEPRCRVCFSSGDK